MEELGAADPRQMGRYRLLARLGAGGMGRVYLGRSTSGRMVAVKVVRAELAEDPDFRRRFAREVESARRVTGFFTAAVVDADPHGTPPWLATAYVPGKALDAAVQDHGAWPRKSLLHLAAGLVEALEAIHAAGLVHRDLKPSNVLLAVDGPRVIDFGISLATEASVLTQTGMVIGTPGFMSPEQVTGRQVGAPSDVFSLGAVLAYAGTGTLPFGIGAAHSVNFRAVYEEPALAGLPDDTGFVARCLAKEPEQRPTVAELLFELGRLLGESGGQTYGAGVPQQTDWLPAGVARALRDSTGTGTAAPSPATPAAPLDPRDALVKRPAPPEPAEGRPQGQGPTLGAGAGAAGPVAATPPAGGPAPLSAPEPAPVPAPSPAPTPVPEMPRTPPPPMPSSPPPIRVQVPESPWTPPVGTASISGTTTSTPASGGPRARVARSRRIAAIAAAVVLVAGGGVTTAVLLNQYGAKDKGDDHASDGGTSGGGKDGKGLKTGFDAAVGNVVNASTRKGGTLKLASSADADSWDAGRSYYGWVWNFQRLYARTLLTYDTKPGKQGTELVPDLASARPEVSADGRTYTVRLRPGLKFEDGTPITSRDVKYAVERVFAQDVLVGGPVYFVELLDQGQGYKGPYKDTSSGGLRTVETPNDSTLVFKLAKPNALFPHLLATGATSPVPKSRDNGARYGEHPVASGPYKFSSLTAGKSLVLVRNENWDQATDPVRKALPDRVELSIDVNAVPEVRARALLDGTVHLDAQQGGLPAASVPALLAEPAKKAQTDAALTGYLSTVALVSKTAPFDNEHCRKAVLYAADTGALQTARGGPTAGVPYGSMLPPTIPGSDDYDPFELTKGSDRSAKARDELRACGRSDGFSTTMLVREGRVQDEQAAAALQNALKRVGIKVEIERQAISTFYATTGSPSAVKSKNYGLIMSGWAGDFPEGGSFLQPLSDGRLITQTGNTNLAQVNDATLNSLFDEASATTDPTKAADLYRQINHRLTDGAYYLPVSARKSLNYRDPRLTNVYVSRAYGMVDFQALGLEAGGAS
ncbi:ABC transporter substrate-binding protein [Streptomyces sp. NPDC090025]|uniref:ABC transporter substrate-binding protein n=1 Tax=Streptomyces sp. NPDC090025 TaxID=3365922 RepID=UPI003833E331